MPGFYDFFCLVAFLCALCGEKIKKPWTPEAAHGFKIFSCISLWPVYGQTSPFILLHHHQLARKFLPIRFFPSKDTFFLLHPAYPVNTFLLLFYLTFFQNKGLSLNGSPLMKGD
jgi:hypothetical protein